jgi:hypothetical protein
MDKLNWPNIKARCQLIENGELFYDFLFGIQSHAIHGNWQDLLFNHLIERNEGFNSNIDWSEPKSQMLEGVISFNLKIIEMFVNRELNDISKEINSLLDEMKNYSKLLYIKHEDFLNKKIQYQ